MHPHYQNTWRIGSIWANSDGRSFDNTDSPGFWVKELKDKRSEVTHATRIAYIGYPTSLNHKAKERSELNIDNIREGNVIKPINVSFNAKGERVIFKHKNQLFSEVSRGPKKNNTKGSEIDKGQLEEIYSQGLLYLNQNRLDAVVSKIGHDEAFQNTDKLTGMFVNDAIKDFQKDDPGLFRYCSPNHDDGRKIELPKWIKKKFHSIARALVDEQLYKNDE